MTLVVLVAGCKRQPSPLLIGDEQGGAENLAAPDLGDIEQSGELIAVTLNGPDTYYEYRNRPAGLQFMMAEAFANKLGLRLRMEVARDTAELFTMLRDAKADLIACELPPSLLRQQGFEPCGANSDSGSWAVRSSSPELLDALDGWYGAEARAAALTAMQQVSTNRFRVQRAQAVFYSKSKGVVSTYDALFLRASRLTGWDWKLLASQCYQESGFDKDAVSWAGARGLMQIMPSTARGMGVSPDALFDPGTNVMTAARVIQKLEGRFAGIKNPTERKKFVLAAYNGGYGHVSDAMALARKYGKNPYSWNDVSYFVLNLSEARFYKDPVVKCGYMVGSETYNYVNAVMGRWQGYHSVLHNALPQGIGSGTAGVGENPHKRNRFSKKQNIAGRDDTLFRIRR